MPPAPAGRGTGPSGWRQETYVPPGAEVWSAFLQRQRSRVITENAVPYGLW